MIINVDGVNREATQEETALFMAELEQIKYQPKSIQEQVDELRNSQLDIAEALTSIYESGV